MDERPIYLDNHATTRVDPRGVETMLPYFTNDYGNAGSVSHSLGHHAREVVDSSRESIAKAICTEPAEIVFTSGATESNNLAIRGVAERRRRRGDHLISVVTEHHAVLEPLQRLEKKGFKLTLLEVAHRGLTKAGWLDPQRVADAITDDTCLVSVMLANNEIGVVQPLAEIATLCREHGVLLHTDATQAVGKMSVDVRQLGVDLMSFSAHKMYGPKGVGALYVRSRDPIVRLDPLISGGGQERGRRSGTLNVPGIVGFARAVELCMEELHDETQRLAKFRNLLLERLSLQIEGLELCGPDLHEKDLEGRPIRLPGNLNIHIPGIDGEAILLRTPQIAASSGAACSSADPEPSHVLQALGYSSDEARCALRFGIGRYNTEEEVLLAAQQVSQAVADLRSGT